MNDPSSPSPRPAGWYIDPAASRTHHRYWDGSRWTDQFRSRPPDAAVADAGRFPAPRPRHRRRWAWWRRR
ncbi:DUF2510 domain-containing protein [Nocardioides sp. zg-536]|uniref:DUF2510 domain-containing protein n=1 Tax=Nocardioides faecalis TaxID=2803858 RepID=A0A939BUH7_9ACTN|nr:DUF2510 domain-containing protein [Nocardioides faecalis]QVI58522.1 DUF2510 domain-containing protein [Nocardioides faecalis]